jgi:hypothetical protein
MWKSFGGGDCDRLGLCTSNGGEVQNWTGVGVLGQARNDTAEDEAEDDEADEGDADDGDRCCSSRRDTSSSPEPEPARAAHS